MRNSWKHPYKGKLCQNFRSFASHLCSFAELCCFAASIKQICMKFTVLQSNCAVAGGNTFYSFAQFVLNICTFWRWHSASHEPAFPSCSMMQSFILCWQSSWHIAWHDIFCPTNIHLIPECLHLQNYWLYCKIWKILPSSVLCTSVEHRCCYTDSQNKLNLVTDKTCVVLIMNDKLL